MSKTENEIVSTDESDIRLDRWFRRHYPQVTHIALQKLLRTGQIRVEGKRAEASTRLVTGQCLRIPPQLALIIPEPVEKKAAQKSENLVAVLREAILFQDDDVLAINKPAGLAVQGGTGLTTSLDDLLPHLVAENAEKPRLVHRLDRDTSGVMLVALNAFAAAKLTEAFRERETEKIYWGVTVGVPTPAKDQIITALARQGEKMAVVHKLHADAKQAVTEYRILQRKKDIAALVEMQPLTGRTHQLRVHMAHIGTPLLGDRMYGGTPTAALAKLKIGKGLHLHARRLVIPHPRKGSIDVTAALYDSFQQTLISLGMS